MKNTPATLLTLICLALGSFAGFAADPDSTDPGQFPAPIRVACVGDSITLGVGADDGKSYPSQLQALLGDKWQVQNFGVSGRTLLKKGELPYWNEQAFKDAQAFQPDVVIIMLGTNDTKPQNWVHHNEFYTDYKSLVETFKNLPSKPRVYVCRPCPVPEPGNYGINETNLQIEIRLVNTLAAEEKIGLIDMHAALVRKPELLPDRVHPNNAGAALMARTAAAALMRSYPVQKS